MRICVLVLLLSSAAVAAQEPQPLTAAVEALHPRLIQGHVRFLASDLLEGRAPATRGDALAREYVAAQFERIGLEPGAPGGGYFHC